jgi:hypothetical protein
MRAQIEENIRNPADRESFVRNVVKLTSEWKGYLAVVLSNPYGYHFSVQVKSGLIKYWTEELGLPQRRYKDELYAGFLYVGGVFCRKPLGQESGRYDGGRNGGSAERNSVGRTAEKAFRGRHPRPRRKDDRGRGGMQKAAGAASVSGNSLRGSAQTRGAP